MRQTENRPNKMNGKRGTNPVDLILKKNKSKRKPHFKVISELKTAVWFQFRLDSKRHRPQFEHFLKDFFDEHKRHLAENVHAFCVIL